MKSIEIATRQHLHQPVTVSNCPIQEIIVNDALKSEEILQNGEMVALFPVKYEAYCVELLKGVVILWTTLYTISHSQKSGMNSFKGSKEVKHGTRSMLKKDGYRKGN